MDREHLRLTRLDVVLAVATVGLGIALSARWWDLPRYPIPVVQAGFPVLGLLALLWLVVLLLVRRWRVAFLAVAVLLVPTVPAVGALGSDTVPSRTGDEIVMAANLEFGAADAQALVDEVRRRGVTTLVLTEFTPSAQERLHRAGLDEVLPHVVGEPGASASGTAIRSRHRLTPVEVPVSPRSFDQPAARVHLDGGQTYLVRGVHTFPPSMGLSQAWRGHLEELEDWAQSRPSSEPVVMAGDFNASQAHPGFRKLADGYTDAHRAAGGAWVRTWPQESSIPPFIALDHVLVRDGEVIDAGQVAVPDTDHAVVWARLRLG